MFINISFFLEKFRKISKFTKFIINNKILKFKKQKWKTYILHLKEIKKPFRYKKFRLLDQNIILFKFFTSKYNSYKILSKNLFIFYKVLKFYFYLKRNKNKNNLNLTILFENRIDFILLSCNICSILKIIQNYIKNGFIYLNKYKITYKSYKIKSGDFIKININFINYKIKIYKTIKWPLPFYNLIINYATKEIFFLKNCEQKTSFIFNFFPIYIHFYN